MDIESVREKAWRAVQPLKQPTFDQASFRTLFTSAKRTVAGRSLPPYYLIYFLLADLLGFRNLGRSDKTAWSLPVELDGMAFLIEHRKMGLGIFGVDGPDTEVIAERISQKLHKAVKAARPYFDWLASEAARQSHLNVSNRSHDLYERFDFYLGLYEARASEAETRKGEVIKTQSSPTSWWTHRPSCELRREARWFALAAIESFFSWTEHIFIHIAILRGRCATGEQVAALAAADWPAKYKAALDLSDAEDLRFYNELVVVRRQLRNFVAHGAFGKDGEALQFHSNVGAVPMLLPHKRDHKSFRFGSGLDFHMEPTIELIKAFMRHVWTGDRSPAEIYIQKYGLPLILTHVTDGTYADAMRSDEDMEEFASYLIELMDRYADMDF